MQCIPCFCCHLGIKSICQSFFCLVVALLFVAELVKLHIGTVVALSFILAMGLLITSLISFLVEVRMSLIAIHIRPELLEK